MRDEDQILDSISLEMIELETAIVMAEDTIASLEAIGDSLGRGQLSVETLAMAHTAFNCATRPVGLNEEERPSMESLEASDAQSISLEKVKETSLKVYRALRDFVIKWLKKLGEFLLGVEEQGKRLGKATEKLLDELKDIEATKPKEQAITWSSNRFSYMFDGSGELIMPDDIEDIIDVLKESSDIVGEHIETRHKNTEMLVNAKNISLDINELVIEGIKADELVKKLTKSGWVAVNNHPWKDEMLFAVVSLKLSVGDKGASLKISANPKGEVTNLALVNVPAYTVNMASKGAIKIEDYNDTESRLKACLALANVLSKTDDGYKLATKDTDKLIYAADRWEKSVNQAVEKGQLTKTVGDRVSRRLRRAIQEQTWILEPWLTTRRLGAAIVRTNLTYVRECISQLKASVPDKAGA